MSRSDIPAVAEFARTMLEVAPNRRISHADLLCAFHGWQRAEDGDDYQHWGARWLIPKLRMACPQAVLIRTLGKRWVCGVKLTDEALEHWTRQVADGERRKGLCGSAADVNQEWDEAAENMRLRDRKSHARARVSNGRDLLPGVDGRSAIARRYRDIASAIIADQGGADRLSESRQQLIRRFAAAAVLAEAMEARLANGETIDISEHALLCSTLVRVAQRIGINRAQKVVPSLHEYLDGAAAS